MYAPMRQSAVKWSPTSTLAMQPPAATADTAACQGTLTRGWQEMKKAETTQNAVWPLNMRSKQPVFSTKPGLLLNSND